MVNINEKFPEDNLEENSEICIWKNIADSTPNENYIVSYFQVCGRCPGYDAGCYMYARKGDFE